LNAPGFNPCAAYGSENLVSKFAFKFQLVPVHIGRDGEEFAFEHLAKNKLTAVGVSVSDDDFAPIKVGRCRLNQVDP
jgi:hypothetical protein